MFANGMGGECSQNEVGHEAQFLVSSNGKPHIPADDNRCLDTLTMLDKTGFETSVIFLAKAGVIETIIDECLEWIITGPFGNK
jgi:hypothetical protein